MLPLTDNLQIREQNRGYHENVANYEVMDLSVTS